MRQIRYYSDVRHWEEMDASGMEHIPVKAVRAENRLYGPEALSEDFSFEAEPKDGILHVYGPGCCMVALAEREMDQNREKSCGKCTFCREGFQQIHTRLYEITSGKGEPASLDLIREIGEAMPWSCSCAIGTQGCVFVLETLRLFEEEYWEHIRRKRCPANQCTAFVTVYIDPAKCKGCGACQKACTVSCIEGLPGYISMIEDMDCTKCGKCMEACEEQAIVRTTDRVPRLPDRLTRVGRFKRY